MARRKTHRHPNKLANNSLKLVKDTTKVAIGLTVLNQTTKALGEIAK